MHGATGKQDARMGVTFESFPPVLHLHLMRYEYNSQYGAMVKLHNRHEFPLRLNLSEFVSKDVERKEQDETFLLHGVLVHSGGMHCGHYYAYVRPFLGDQDPKRSNRWFCFDDDHVYPVEERDAVESNFGGAQQQKRSSFRRSRSKKKRRKLLGEDGKDEEQKQDDVIIKEQDNKNQVEEEEDDDDDDEYMDTTSSNISLSLLTGGSSSCAYMLAYIRERDIPNVMKSSYNIVPKSLEKRIEMEMKEEEEKKRKLMNEKMIIDVAIWTEKHVRALCTCSRDGSRGKLMSDFVPYVAAKFSLSLFYDQSKNETNYHILEQVRSVRENRDSS